MKEAEDRILRLQAALDGELDAEAMLAFERACAENPALAQEFSRLQALDEALRRALPAEPAPAGLRKKIAAMGEAPRARRVSFAQAGALAASLIFGVFIGYGGGLLRAPAPDEERALVSAFTRAEIGGQGVDIAASDRHVIKPWLASRAPLAVAAVDLAASGFPLAGGRVEALDGRILPTLVYRRREHRIEVTELPLDGRKDSGVAFGGFNGFRTARWSDRDRAYVAVTDLPQPDLAHFVSLFRDAVASEQETAPAK